MIRILHTSIGYKTPLLQIQELELKKGNTYVILGKNGAGKTTFLRCLLGESSFLSSDEVSVDSSDLRSMDPKEKTEYISFVSSRPALAEYMSVQEYVSLGRTPYLNAFGTLRKEDLEAVEKSIGLCGISHLKDRSMDAISDGERQMAAVAKALAQNTPYILLDEPTAYLDYTNKRKLVDQLIAIAEKENKCVIFTSHDVELVLSSSCETITILRDQKKMILNEVKPTLQELIENVF